MGAKLIKNIRWKKLLWFMQHDLSSGFLADYRQGRISNSPVGEDTDLWSLREE